MCTEIDFEQSHFAENLVERFSFDINLHDGFDV